ncbi:hypothetical protein KDA23_06750 [Candidatus Saccharibacteria bacterium]|nr:hypothetical protein [Candidatus Saccharibacteria bacterium]
MFLDYKIAEEREDDGVIYQKVRYYEGDTTTEDERNPDNPDELIPVTRYRRVSLIEEVEYEYEAN